jgi:hypothetical protein
VLTVLLQMFTGGGGGGGGGRGGGGAGGLAALMGGGGGGGGGGAGGQNAFLGMAMGEAGKLFDQQSAQGNVAPGTNKQSVINSAAAQAFKMYMSSQGGGSGGAGGLMSLASKFM